jgi:beta-lactamase superfamily II metal-dependent hydrolase
LGQIKDLRVVNPRVAVFSVRRDSRFGHPHPVVIDRYTTMGAQVFRSDVHGAVTVRTDGQSVWVTPYSGGPAALSPSVTHSLAETLARPTAALR